MIPLQTYEFTLILEGAPEMTDELIDSAFEAGCDDGVIGQFNNIVYILFDREATNREEAIKSAIRNVESIGPYIKAIIAPANFPYPTD